MEQYIIISRNQIQEDDYSSFKFHFLDRKIEPKLCDAINEIYVKINQPLKLTTLFKNMLIN